jgi:hypothetical protein
LSQEDLDRTSIVSETVPDDIPGLEYPYALAKTRYTGHWVHFRYKITPKVHFTFVGMLDVAEWDNADQDPLNTNGETKIRDAWGYIPADRIFSMV